MSWKWIYLTEMLDSSAPAAIKGATMQVIALWPPNIVTVSALHPALPRCAITVKSSGVDGFVLVRESMAFVMNEIERAAPRTGVDPTGLDAAESRLAEFMAED